MTSRTRTTKHRSLRAFAAIAAAAVFPASAASQPLARIDSTPACQECRITLGAPTQLRGGLDDGTLPNLAQGVRRLANGRFLALFDGELSQLLEYNAAGGFEGRNVGQRGSGPGEFAAIKHDFSVVGDTVVIYDWVQRRRTDLDAGTYRTVRSGGGVPDGFFASVNLPNGHTVFSGPIATRNTAGQPLHVYRFDQQQGRYEWVRSFGVQEPALRPGISSLLYRRVHPSADGGFWSAHYNEYRLEAWSTDGQLRRTLVGERRWFPPWTQAVVRSTEQPPNPVVAAVTTDSDGLLWLLFGVAHPNWRDAISDERDIMGSRLLHPDKPYLVSVIEVIDPVRNVLIAQQRFDVGYWGFAAPGFLWRTWTDAATAEPRVEVVPVRLTGR